MSTSIRDQKMLVILHAATPQDHQEAKKLYDRLMAAVMQAQHDGMSQVPIAIASSSLATAIMLVPFVLEPMNPKQSN
jgi:hypothetical protein